MSETWQSAKSTDPQAKPPTNFDLVKFLYERAHGEGALFWQRNTVFLTINTALAALLVTTISKAGSLNPMVSACVSSIGLVLAAIWIVITHRGRVMNHAWVRAANAVLNGDAELLNRLRGTDIVSPAPASKRIGIVDDILWNRSATTSWWMYPLAIVFVLGWFVLLAYSTCHLFTAQLSVP